MATQFNIDLKWIVIAFIAIVIFFGGGFGIMNKRHDNTKSKLLEEKILTEALQDSITFWINDYNEVVSDKRSLQADIETLSNENLNLTNNQKELLKRLKKVQKDKSVIAAALVKTKAKLDSALYTKVDVNLEDSTITFIEDSDSIKFKIVVLKAIPANPKFKPSLFIDSLELPNKQYIQFHWENDKQYKQKPVSFSITNSNPLFITQDIDSYVIPEINKNVLKPTGAQKLGNFLKERKAEFIIGTIGGAVGLYIGATQF